MAFDFLGRINSIEEFEEFEEFVNIEVKNIDLRTSHLQKEKSRYYKLLDKFKIADLKLRSKYTKTDQPDANWIKTARPITDQKNITDLDNLNAIDVGYLKKMFIDTIKYRREKNEFKIKRIRDLIEQFSNEISFLNDMKLKYSGILNKIRNRFDLKDFKEVQRVPFSDPADQISGIRAIEKDAGREIVGDITYYFILGIDGDMKRIYFENIAPPLKLGDKLSISGGKNTGIKATVSNILGKQSIEVYETLITDSSNKNNIIKIEKVA